MSLIQQILKNRGLDSQIAKINHDFKFKIIDQQEANSKIANLVQSLELTDDEMQKAEIEWDSRFRSNKTLIIGNGDIQSLEEAYSKAKEYELDGIMVGRGILNNIFLFNSNVKRTLDGGLIWKDGTEVTIKDRIGILIIHLDLWQKTWGDSKNYNVLKKYFKIYINGFPGAVELRTQLMATNDIEGAKEILMVIWLQS